MSTVIDEDVLSEAERIKGESYGLRGTLAEELSNDASHLTGAAKALLKFHGSYEQEDRDQRKERKKAGLELAYQFMIRSKIPGGVLTADQYLLHDQLADRYGNGSIRITTRQGFQLHGVLKRDLRATIHEINGALLTTLGACGDVVRNIVACAAPFHDGLHEEISEWTRRLTAELLPRTTGYHEIWIDGAEVTRPILEPDALYRDRYLPRKFKVGFAFPDDNCTDVHSNDLGLLVIAENGKIQGFNLYVGGGLGKTHGKAETYPRLAEEMAFVRPDELIEVVKAVISVQRDYGNRVNRKRARLKYLLDERGLEWFRGQVEEIIGRRLAPPVPVEVTEIHDHVGWHEQGDGRLFRGVWIENGRIVDNGGLRLRSALRVIVSRFKPGVHLTLQQNLLLTDIAPENREEIDAILADHGVTPTEELTLARRHSMACPALPTCPLAVAESERVMPGVMDELEAEIADLELADVPITIRMTGCPNGCARPYTADMAFVGRSLGKYMIYIGGNFEGTRLGNVYADLVPTDEIVATVRPLLERFRGERRSNEGFGDFVHRVGVEPVVRERVRAGASS